MKKITIILITVFYNVVNYSQQKDFEKTLGAENVKTLNLLLTDFENNFLKRKYSNLEIKNAYKQFLSEFVEKKITLEKTVSKEMKNTFNKSLLKQNIYCVADSVYAGKSKYDENKKAIIAKYKCLKPNNTFEYTRTEIYCCEDFDNTNNTLERTKNSIQINMIGLFLKALKKTKNKSSFLKNYIEYIELTGDLRNPIIMSDLILKNHLNLNDYILKRLILVNIIYRH
ncbi:hypothetical protein [uncultured Tenacibaculum sp.]|uniref:hypothetical protein n=1 Tax=uncultured Tenacibaculum sp. TaxID=174713 RepID=UPI00262EFCF4|nr:hypothetical protein [uncultured Tenacibaculum sp.]